tara:strand:- start:5526 stop:6119 length:594 start_codon:yes stop_codon:yes gene_type:complete
MAIYNGAIKIRPCTVINIPQPGVVQELDLGLTGVYNNAGPQPIITSLPPATTQLLIENNVGGGDVIYATDTSTADEYIFQIEYIDVATNTIVLFDICSPPAAIALGDLVAEVYRGNYNPTLGTGVGPAGPTGAGNSEGYSLYTSGGGTATVLTVNNDLLILPLNLVPSVLDLQVVKVLELTGAGPEPPEAWAFRVQQ